jgi:membrane fusion protein (multidrug efflux system)
MKRQAPAVAAVLLKRVLPLVAGLAVLVLVIAWMAGFFEQKIPAGQYEAAVRRLPEGAKTYEVEPIIQPFFEEAVGTLKAASRTEISARIMARINEIKVRAGQLVQRDAELIVLDSRDLATKESQAEASLAAAQAALGRAESDYKRDLQLYQKKVVSQEQMDASTERVKMARANRRLAEEALAETRIMLSYATIRAPQPGMIVDQLAKEGDTARPGEPLLTLYDPNSLRLEVPVMENLAVKLKVGQHLTVEIPARGNRKIPATVDEIVPQAEAASRSFLVKLRLPRSEDLFEGMYGRLEIPAGQRRFLCLARAAIDRVGQLEFVDVVGPGKVLQRRLIKTGRGREDRVEVLSGLEAHERVWLKSPAGAGQTPTSESAPQPKDSTAEKQ